MNCQFTDRVEIAIVTDSAEFRAAIEQFREYIMTETLAVSIVFEPMAGVEPVDIEIGDYRADFMSRVVPRHRRARPDRNRQHAVTRTTTK